MTTARKTIYTGPLPPPVVYADKRLAAIEDVARVIAEGHNDDESSWDPAWLHDMLAEVYVRGMQDGWRQAARAEDFEDVTQ